MKKVTSDTPREVLENIKKGDIVEDIDGKIGEVVEIDKLYYHNGKHYYYRIKNNGTIQVIK